MNNIEILENYVKELNENKKNHKLAYSIGFGKYWSDFGKAIENLIKENKELKAKYFCLEQNYFELHNEKISKPKSKVKDYLNKMEKRCNKPKFSVMKKDIEKLLEEGE